MTEKANRKNSFWHSDTPLTSKRAKIILSKNVDALNMTKAFMGFRKGNVSTFTVSEETAQRLKSA